jgi:hypothetical protein
VEYLVELEEEVLKWLKG